MLREIGAHSSARRFSSDSGLAVGGTRMSRPTSASEGCKFITKPVGVGVPAFKNTKFTETTSPAVFKPAFTKSNCDARNLLTLSMLFHKFSIALLSYNFAPCPDSPLALITNHQGELSP
uniref:Uncharacterized protein n=1 Tax=Opuntia streptacantha TaxID=393608 RepID=A0A7C8ZA92_OPUST